ncbi:uncharacterized protein [Clytia hemisphaerica]|uniref:uncharacterized protein n=1 Tax=Clytia hemisphaerica TaxID=252671 RepID=UPI0034D3B24D
MVNNEDIEIDKENAHVELNDIIIDMEENQTKKKSWSDRMKKIEQVWSSGFDDVLLAPRFVPLRSVPNCSTCGSKNMERYKEDSKSIVITLEGRYMLSHYLLVCNSCKQCENPFVLKNIIASGFWPTTPTNFNYLIKTDVFLLWDQFRKSMPGSSVSSFLQSLNALTVFHGRKESDVSCGGDWTAARNLPRKKSTLDDTGLQVATCRHQFVQKSLNMKRGEIFAYSHFIVRNFVLPNNITFMFSDVMCKLYKYLCRAEPKVVQHLKGALSVMHAKGHSINCQIVKKPEAAMFWNKRKSLNLVDDIMKKYRRNVNDDDVILLRTGLQFAENQLWKGLQQFTPLEPDVLEYYSSFIVNRNATSDKVNDILQSEDESSDEWDDEIEKRITDIESDTDVDPGDLDVYSIRNTGIVLTRSLKLKEIVNQQLPSQSIILPNGFSQGTMNHRNGSNSCTLIAILVGLVFSNFSDDVLHPNDIIGMEQTVKLFVGAMETGNMLNDYDEFMHVAEALERMHQLNIELKHEQNCFASDLASAIKNIDSLFCLVQFCGKSCLVVKKEELFFLFDSHSHEGKGGLIFWHTDPIVLVGKLNILSEKAMCYLCSLVY